MTEDTVESSGISRRRFLKIMGGGTAAAGITALIPGAAGFDITSSDGLKYFNQSSTDSSFEVDPSGTLNANKIAGHNGPLQWQTDQDAQKQNLENIGSLSTDQGVTGVAIYFSDSC
ncbi:hypothetical protein [Natrinema sp. H-ect4]|uniref:hypothetical protein n=1 Tax=Natrinema sp. H-ect4 TaxID=3242699 RepID=UPI0035A977E6